MPLGAGWRAYGEFWILRGVRAVSAGALEELADRWLFVQTAELCIEAANALGARSVWLVRVPLAAAIAVSFARDMLHVRARARASGAHVWREELGWRQLLPLDDEPRGGRLGLRVRMRILSALLASGVLVVASLAFAPPDLATRALGTLRYAVDWLTLGFFDGSLTQQGGGAGVILGDTWLTVGWLSAAGAECAPWTAAVHRRAPTLVLAWFFSNARFARDHAYQGAAGVIFGFVMGLVFADCTARYGFGTAVVLHALWDLASETLLQAEGYLLRSTPT
jgi:hypothetical protein